MLLNGRILEIKYNPTPVSQDLGRGFLPPRIICLPGAIIAAGASAAAAVKPEQCNIWRQVQRLSAPQINRSSPHIMRTTMINCFGLFEHKRQQASAASFAIH